MRVNEKDVEQLVLSSSMDLHSEDKAVHMKALNTILEYMDVLNKLDTSTVEPALHVNAQKNIFREDKVQASYDREIILANAPQQEQGSFKVPRIV